MARARNIKPAFFKNEELAELLPEVRLLFIGLWTLADREGRLEDRPKRIKMELFAYDSFDVESMLNELQTRKFLIRYEISGVRYIHIINFVKHQDPHYRERASEIPPPSGLSNSIVATNVSRTQRQRIYERDNFKCKKCGSEDSLSIDHVTPISKGGDSSDSNLQVLCYPCNHKKGAKLGTNTNEDRVNVDSTSSEHPEASPSSAPLNPDSLIPDSGFLTPDSPTTSKTKNKAKAKVNGHAAEAAFVPPDWVPKTQWDAWIEARKKKRNPPTVFAMEMAVSKLEQLREQGFHPAQVLAQSAFNGWPGLFEVKAQA